ncbi:MAG: pentapeptide repeat-containing protein [Planctomycetota bacterium]|jgi:hypothetical protein
MDESESKNEKPKEEHRFSQEQYDMLIRCSDKKDMTEWNEWRKKNPNEDILLEGAQFRRWHLLGGVFNSGEATGHGSKTHLKGADFCYAHLEQAKFQDAYLSDAKFNHAHLQGADFHDAHVEGAILYKADLSGASVRTVIVDCETSFWKCKVDHDAKFEGTPLDGVRIDSATKQLLEYNIRRMNWEEWYKEHPKLKWLVRTFWLMSDYGLSTGRIIFTFFGLVIIFANIYYNWGAVDYYILRVNGQPGFVENLFVDGNGIEVQWWLVPLRTLYFSIVTMTTLGFGDMYANAQSVWGHILLSVQVILGYVLLGALITRFAVLFTAGGPAGRFSNEKKEG